MSHDHFRLQGSVGDDVFVFPIIYRNKEPAFMLINIKKEGGRSSRKLWVLQYPKFPTYLTLNHSTKLRSQYALSLASYNSQRNFFGPLACSVLFSLNFWLIHFETCCCSWKVRKVWPYWLHLPLWQNQLVLKSCCPFKWGSPLHSLHLSPLSLHPGC